MENINRAMIYTIQTYIFQGKKHEKLFDEIFFSNLNIQQKKNSFSLF